MKLISVLVAFLMACGLVGCGNSGNSNESSSTVESSPDSSPSSQIIDIESEEKETDDMQESIVQNDIGALTPEEALEYMKNTENLVIVDVAAARWYEATHFEGAINIPIEELDTDEENALYLEIPEGQPVILHCRQGVIVPGAYLQLKELRPDIPEISYIAGAPLFDDYNDWLSE